MVFAVLDQLTLLVGLLKVVFSLIVSRVEESKDVHILRSFST